MIANVMKSKDQTRTRGIIGPGDLYIFELGYALRWEYKGKVVGESFIPADMQGTEHIPQEWYAALDRAWHDPNGWVEFEDPYEALEAVV